jgi:hypothetical protein
MYVQDVHDGIIAVRDSVMLTYMSKFVSCIFSRSKTRSIIAGSYNYNSSLNILLDSNKGYVNKVCYSHANTGADNALTPQT